MATTLNTLLTGFGAFGAVTDNPTQRLVAYFAERGAPGHVLTTCVLPVSYKRAPALLLEAIDRGGPGGQPFDLVLMTGVASGSVAWRVERCGRNCNDRARDMDGQLPAPEIIAGGPDLLEATVPVHLLVEAFVAAGLPVELSESAGGYLCNHALYRALHHLRQSGSAAMAGFLHVPADTTTFTDAAAPAQFPFAQHVRAVETALAALRIGQTSKPDSPVGRSR